MSTAEKENNNRKRKKNINTFLTPIKKIHKLSGEKDQVRMAMNAKTVMDALTKHFLEKMIKTIDILLRIKKQKTVQNQTVIIASSLVLNQDLLKMFAPAFEKINAELAKETIDRKKLVVGLGPVTRFLKKNLTGVPRIGIKAKLVLSILTEELIRVIWQKSKQISDQSKNKTIKNRFVKLAIANDSGLNELYKDLIFPGGVIVYTHASRMKVKPDEESTETESIASPKKKAPVVKGGAVKAGAKKGGRKPKANGVQTEGTAVEKKEPEVKVEEKKETPVEEKKGTPETKVEAKPEVTPEATPEATHEKKETTDEVKKETTESKTNGETEAATKKRIAPSRRKKSPPPQAPKKITVKGGNKK